LDNVNVGGNIIKMDMKGIRIVGVFVWIRVKFIYERRENFHETSGCTKHENNLNTSTTIILSKMTTNHRFSYSHSDHLNSFNLISQTIVLKITLFLSL